MLDFTCGYSLLPVFPFVSDTQLQREGTILDSPPAAFIPSMRSL